MDDRNTLDDMFIPEPCPASWEGMTGDDRVRSCAECGQHVYNLTAMSPADADALLRARGDELCGCAFRRPDGTLTIEENAFRAPAQGAFQFTIRSLMAVVAGVAAILGVARLFGQHEKPTTPPPRTRLNQIVMGKMMPRHVSGDQHSASEY
jgi:hypothetical protein